MSNHYPEIDGHKLTDFIHELPFYLGNVIKYAWRAPYKGGTDDTLKLLDYLVMTQDGWTKYGLSDKSVECLSKLSSYDFISNSDGLDRAHRRCIRAASELILDSEGSCSIDTESEKILVLTVSALQVALMRN